MSASRDGFIRHPDVTLSQAVREMAVEQLDRLSWMEPRPDFVVVFQWADSRRLRYPRLSNNWHDLGAGISLWQLERHEVPPDAIAVADGLSFAVQIDERMLAGSEQRMFDVDWSAGAPQVVLR
jgi:hypothetical protein